MIITSSLLSIDPFLNLAAAATSIIPTIDVLYVCIYVHIIHVYIWVHVHTKSRFFKKLLLEQPLKANPIE